MSAEPEVSLAVVESPSAIQLGTLAATTPAQLVASGTALATALAGVIEQQKLYAVISNRKYVKCEGWTTLATMLGVLPREVSVEALEDGGYVAIVELVRMSDGAVVTRASAECGADEKIWMARPKYARRSMAVTRATGKACRIAFSWIVALSGYEPTPFEEIPEEERHAPAAHPQHAAQDTPRPVPATDTPPKPVITTENGKSKVANWRMFLATDAKSGRECLALVPFGRLCGKFLADLSAADLRNTAEFAASKSSGYFPALAAGCAAELERRDTEVPF